MPFFLCQIAPYGYTGEERDNGETQIREEMARFARDYAPRAGLAVLSDVARSSTHAAAGGGSGRAPSSSAVGVIESAWRWRRIA